VQFDDWRIGVLQGDQVFDVTDYLSADAAAWAPVRMVRFVELFPRLHERIETDLAAGRLEPRSIGRLLPPLTRPDKIVGAPVNFGVHLRQDPRAEKYSVRASGFFLKAPSAIVGPADEIRLPPDGIVNYEGELTLVIGKTATDVPAADAYSYIFGYTIMLDMTRKGPEGRSTRKSFDTFAPIGPCIVTADEIADPHDVDVRVWINEELRQTYNTDDMVCRIPELIEYTSSKITLLPGDLFCTGNGGAPDAVHVGDTVRVEIDGIGSMSLPVRGR
jgi:2-keto-4-pentenoate hydratase/2-oxohepta-3-ene-1,7-dioic acid hydratase in catechol pathway